MASAYSSEQISQYLEYIQLPPQWHPSAKPTLNLEYLSILHVHQISTIPYENLSLHYSRDKQVDIEPQHLFDKFLRRKRGGYCLETSIFYNHILRALGFQVYTAAVRIRLRKDGVPYGSFAGWRHIVNIVTLPDPTDASKSIKYMVDVGFGGDGATKPLPLIHDRPQHNLGTQTIRLLFDTIPDQIDRSPSQKLWVFQYRNGPDKPWNTYYAFPEVEYTELEFATLNFWLVNHPDSFQRWTVLIIKFLRGKQGREDTSSPTTTTITTPAKKDNASPGNEPDLSHSQSNGTGHTVNGVPQGLENDDPSEHIVTGKIMLVDGKVKRNLGGKTEVVADLRNEADRVEAIRTWFGIQLTPDEIEAIRGHQTELVAQV